MSTPPAQSLFYTRVISNLGAELLVRHDDLGHFHAQPLKKHGLLVCGDLLICAPPKAALCSFAATDDPHSEILRVQEVAGRNSVLQRTDRRGQAKPIAANLTQLIAVSAPKPPFDPLLIDRYTIAATHMGVKLLLVINKTDLLTTEELTNQADSIESLYRSIGYTVLRCNGKSGDGLDALVNELSGEVSILVGQSGVGKSSILNGLIPDRSIKTGALSEISGLGRHTTTVTTWYELSSGGAIIDSAGVRQFALEHLSDVDIEAGFKEISAASATCKFRNCRHQNEPDCAVKSGLEQQTISRQRYEHFQTISAQSSGIAG